MIFKSHTPDACMSSAELIQLINQLRDNTERHQLRQKKGIANVKKLKKEKCDANIKWTLPVYKVFNVTPMIIGAYLKFNVKEQF